VPKLYTGAGDEGRTSLLGGGKVSKAHLRVEAYGTIDELNAALGAALSFTSDEETALVLQTLQRRLFSLGAEIAAAPEYQGAVAGGIAGEDISYLERTIDSVDARLPKLKSFIIPGGTSAAALLHLARTICRRAERCVVRLNEEEPLRGVVLMYLNRLSDLLFVLARYANHLAGVKENEWSRSENGG
jgi:cob(I)alamin adenosyltransferase